MCDGAFFDADRSAKAITYLDGYITDMVYSFYDDNL